MADSALRTLYKLPSLPALLESNQKYAVDYGASLIKLICRSSYLCSAEDVPQEQLCVVTFLHGQHKQLVEFIKKYFPCSKDKLDQLIIYSTGIGIKNYEKEMKSELNITFKIENEMDCYAKSLKHVLVNVSRDELFWPIPKTAFEIADRVAEGFLRMGKQAKDDMEGDWASDTGLIAANKTLTGTVDQRYDEYGKKTKYFPSLVAICGSGMLCFILKDDHSGAQLVDYCGRSGRTLIGLGSLLTGAQSYDELVDLASKGDDSTIDTYLRDIKGGDDEDWYGTFPNEGLSFCFGKTFQKSISDCRREDLAASLLQMIFDDLAQTAMNVAIANQLPSIIFCGSMLNHEIARFYLTKNFIYRSFMRPKESQVDLYMCKIGPHMGAIGAWLHGIDDGN